MLRNRSRAVTNKQTLMGDHTSSSPSSSLLSPSQKNPTSPISSFLQSPRFFHTFLAKNPPDSDSPTSILDTKNSSSFVNPFGYYDRNLSKSQAPSPDTTTGGHQFGLALIDSIIVEDDEKGSRNYGSSNFPKPVNRMALFGSKLKVQIPAMINNSNNSNQSSSPGEEERSSSISPKSPADFGIKTRQNSLVRSQSTPRDFSRQLSLKEMELSEDYTCVITHGPNPKTTHIFDDCIVECCCGDAVEDADDDVIVGNGTKFSDLNKPDDGCNAPVEQPNASSDFLRFCYTCKDILGHGKDIYIYRGEKAFCSHECRFQEIFSEREEEE